MKKTIITTVFGISLLALNAQVNLTTNAEALNFDGVNDYIQLNDPNFGTSDFTIETWIKPNNAAGSSYLITTRTSEDSGGGNWWSLICLNNKAAIELSDAGGIGTYILLTGLPGSIQNGIWSHIAVVRAGLQTKLYVNGTLEATHNDTFLRNFNTGANSLRYGGWVDFNTAYYNGSMDETRLWNIARTQCEINTYKNAEIANNANGLLINNHYNQGLNASNNVSIDSLQDLSGASNTGTLTNFALTGNSSNWVSPGAVISNYTLALPATSTVSVSNNSICLGESATINITGADSYTLSAGLTNGVSFTPTVTSTYTAITTNTLISCTYSNIVTIQVNQPTTNTVTVNGCENYTENSVTYTTSGVYTQTLTNSIGCDSVLTINLTIGNIDATVTQVGNSLSANATGYNYQWIDCNNSNAPINNETSQTYNATSNGNYAVIIASSNCTVTSICYSLTTTGINSIGYINTMISILPNPANQSIQIQGVDFSEGVRIKIISIDGKIMKDEMINQSNISISDLNSGMYFMELTDSEGKTGVTKFIKE